MILEFTIPGLLTSLQIPIPPWMTAVILIAALLGIIYLGRIIKGRFRRPGFVKAYAIVKPFGDVEERKGRLIIFSTIRRDPKSTVAAAEGFFSRPWAILADDEGCRIAKIEIGILKEIKDDTVLQELEGFREPVL